jgi:hypothetical protein
VFKKKKNKKKYPFLGFEKRGVTRAKSNRNMGRP